MQRLGNFRVIIPFQVQEDDRAGLCGQLVNCLVQDAERFLPGDFFQEITILRIFFIQMSLVAFPDPLVLAMVEVNIAGNRVHESLRILHRLEFLPVLEYPRESLLYTGRKKLSKKALNSLCDTIAITKSIALLQIYTFLLKFKV